MLRTPDAMRKAPSETCQVSPRHCLCRCLWHRPCRSSGSSVRKGFRLRGVLGSGLGLRIWDWDCRGSLHGDLVCFIFVPSARSQLRLCWSFGCSIPISSRLELSCFMIPEPRVWVLEARVNSNHPYSQFPNIDPAWWNLEIFSTFYMKSYLVCSCFMLCYRLKHTYGIMYHIIYTYLRSYVIVNFVLIFYILYTTYYIFMVNGILNREPWFSEVFDRGLWARWKQLLLFSSLYSDVVTWMRGFSALAPSMQPTVSVKNPHLTLTPGTRNP